MAAKICKISAQLLMYSPTLLQIQSLTMSGNTRLSRHQVLVQESELKDAKIFAHLFEVPKQS